MGVKSIIIIAAAILIIAAGSLIYLGDVGGIKSSIHKGKGSNPEVQPQAPSVSEASGGSKKGGSVEDVADIIETLKKQREKIKMKEDAEEALRFRLRSLQTRIEQKLKELDDIEQKITQKMDQLKALEQKIQNINRQIQSKMSELEKMKPQPQTSQVISQQELKKLAKGYEDMRSSKAAEMLSQMVTEGNEKLVLDILRNMDKATALEILSNFKNKSQAAKLQVGLLRVESSGSNGS